MRPTPPEVALPISSHPSSPRIKTKIRMEGFATMYMRMPMSSSALPIAGSCSVDDKKITLKFPFTGIEFDLPSAPKEIKDVTDDFKIDFKIRTSSGGVMAINIGYIPELKTFVGCGKQDEDENPCLSFNFFNKDSAMSKLPKC